MYTVNDVNAMRTGVTPLLTLMLLTAIVLVLGVGTYSFLSGQQNLVIGKTETAQLETVNATCDRAGVDWWIRNTATHPTSEFADALFTEDGQVNDSLTVRNLRIPNSISGGYGAGEVTIPAQQPLKRGQRYDIELLLAKTELETSCITGDAWWNINWNYRRATSVPTIGLLAVTLDTETLINQQKLRPDCADIRIVQDGTVRPYDITDSECDTNATTVLFDAASAGTPYVYYGNLAARSMDTTLSGSSTSATLYSEERTALP